MEFFQSNRETLPPVCFLDADETESLATTLPLPEEKGLQEKREFGKEKDIGEFESEEDEIVLKAQKKDEKELDKICPLDGSCESLHRFETGQQVTKKDLEHVAEYFHDVVSPTPPCKHGLDCKFLKNVLLKEKYGKKESDHFALFSHPAVLSVGGHVLIQNSSKK